MRSELRVSVGDRFGEIFIVSMSVLFFEAVTGAIALFVWSQTREGPALPYNALMVLALPVFAVCGAAAGALLTLGGVVPLLMLARWASRRVQGRDSSASALTGPLAGWRGPLVTWACPGVATVVTRQAREGWFVRVLGWGRSRSSRSSASAASGSGRA